MRPDEDPKLELGSRTSKSKTPRPTKENRQAEGPTPGGAGDGISAETGPSHQVVNDDIGSAFLTADAPRSYHDAMQHNDADSWVEAIAEEYNVLCRKGVFVEVEPPIESTIHNG